MVLYSGSIRAMNWDSLVYFHHTRRVGTVEPIIIKENSRAKFRFVNRSCQNSFVSTIVDTHRKWISIVWHSNRKKIIAPIFKGIERTFFGCIVNENYAISTTIKCFTQSTVAFLSSCIPNLYCNGFIVDLYLFDNEIKTKVRLKHTIRLTIDGISLGSYWRMCGWFRHRNSNPIVSNNPSWKRTSNNRVVTRYVLLPAIYRLQDLKVINFRKIYRYIFIKFVTMILAQQGWFSHSRIS